MTTEGALDVAVLTGVNSTAFVERALALYDGDLPVAIVRPELDLAAYPGLNVASHETPQAVTGWLSARHTPRESDEIAQIVFTSGTEGRPKAIALSHRNLADVVARLNAVMRVDETIREYIGVPVTYAFGLGRARAVSAAGGAFFLPAAFSPSEIGAMLRAGEINALSAVPSLFRLILEAPQEIGEAGAAMRWIEIGSQYMSREEKEALARLFPSARIVMNYGLTEASRTTFLDISAETGPALETVGRPTGGAEVEIGGEGEIRIRGPHVALGLVGDDGRIAPLTDAEGWLTTSDRGEMRDGRLAYLGRLDDQINIAGRKLGAERLERLIAGIVAAPEGSFAVAAAPDPLRGQVPLLAVEAGRTDLGPALEAAARAALEREGISGAALIRRDVEALPRTPTGKIKRAELTRADDKPAPKQAGAPRTAREGQVADAWRTALGPVPLTPDQSLYDAGGDSLSSVQVALAMEAAGLGGPPARAALEGRSLAEVAALDAAAAPSDAPRPLPGATAKSWAANAVRGVMAGFILFSHFGPGVVNVLGLPPAAQEIFIYNNFGLPGFAFIFGAGLALAAPQGASMRRAGQVALVLALALIVVAGVRFSAHAALGGAADARAAALVFNNVLVFFIIATLLAPGALRLAARATAPPAAAAAAGGAFALIFVLARQVWNDAPLASPLELIRVLTVAGGSAPKLAALACFGAALGLWLRGVEAGRGARLTLRYGAAVALLGLAMAQQAHGFPEMFHLQVVFGGGALTTLTLQIGLVTMLFGAMLSLAASQEAARPPMRAGLRALVAAGALALPIYALHQLVFPLRDIAVVYGAPAGLTLLALMAAVFGALFAAWFWLVRLYRGV